MYITINMKRKDILFRREIKCQIWLDVCDLYYGWYKKWTKQSRWTNNI